MRTKKSLINVAISCSSYILCMVSTFIIRGVFSRLIGADFAGIESTFMNAISMLAIVELGIGTGIVYKLYKPIADGDKREIALLLKFYKQAYTVIGGIVFFIGIIVSVVIPSVINENYSHTWLSFIFFLYLVDILASYLFANRRAMFVADQKNFITSVCYTASQFLNLIIQIVVLCTLPGVMDKETVFAVYLIIKIAVRLFENCAIAILFKKNYPDIELNIKGNISAEEKSTLFSKIRALMVHKVAGLSLQATSSLIVTKFVDVIRGGYYGNYLSLSNAVNNIGMQFFNGITASFGDLYVSEGKAQAYKKFKSVFFVNYILYSFFSVSFFIISEPFVELWIGNKEAVFPSLTVYLMSVYIYMYGIRQCIFVARNVTGEYTKDKWFAVLEAVINFVSGVFLVSKVGVIGIPIGNILSTLLVPYFVQSRIVYRDIFGVRVSEYHKVYVRYFVTFALSGGVCYALCRAVYIDSLLLEFVFRVAVCVVVPNVINIVFYRKTEEFCYIKSSAMSLLSKFIKK